MLLEVGSGLSARALDDCVQGKEEEAPKGVELDGPKPAPPSIMSSSLSDCIPPPPKPEGANEWDVEIPKEGVALEVDVPNGVEVDVPNAGDELEKGVLLVLPKPCC